MTSNRNRPRAAAAPPTQTDNAPTTKSARLLAMLRAPNGASIEEISITLSWQTHSARAALTGLRKKGHDISRGKQGSVTAYRIIP